MSKTIKELAEEFGVSKTAIRNKLTEEFRSKWVQTSTANGVQTLVITEEGRKSLKINISRWKPDRKLRCKPTANQFAVS